MNFVLRGALAIGLYMALSLAPLAVSALCDPVAEKRSFAIELSAALGFVAFALLAIEFSLVARLRLASRPFGTDALMLVHKYMGIAGVAFAFVHTLLVLGREGRTALFSGSLARQSGVLALGCAVLLVGIALSRRRIAFPHETWLRLHGALAVAIAAAMLVHVLFAGRYVESGIVRAVLVAYAALFLALLVHHRVVRPMLLSRKPWAVVANRDEGASVRTLVLRPDGHAGFGFEPGQFAWLGTHKTPFGWHQHPMTISSSAVLRADRAIEMSIKALGDWSRTDVPAIQPGARVWVEGPFGSFTPDRVPAEGFVLIAGGIGITPMRSILLSLRDRGDRRPVCLVYATRNLDRAPFAAELAALREELELELVHVLEEPPADWSGERGFITADVIRRHLPASFARWQFFVCGPSAMMAAVERALVEIGVPAERVHTERFDMV